MYPLTATPLAEFARISAAWIAPLAEFARISAAWIVPLAEFARISAAWIAPLADSVLNSVVRFVIAARFALPEALVTATARS